jgi:hypothetical protein
MGPSPETWRFQAKIQTILAKPNRFGNAGREATLKMHLAHSQLVERM